MTLLVGAFLGGLQGFDPLRFDLRLALEGGHLGLQAGGFA